MSKPIGMPKLRGPVGPLEMDASFAAKHPYRIDLADGGQVRFATLGCAAQTAVALNLPVWDELAQNQYSARDCYRISAETRARWEGMVV